MLPHIHTLAHEQNRTEVWAQFESMAASTIFSSSPQLISFLRYVIEATLRGKQNSVKAYVIATEALGRGPRFDPQIDPIVRVDATRLRRAIERYYQTEGADDRIVIDLPRGSYIPTFRYRDGQTKGIENNILQLPLLVGDERQTPIQRPTPQPVSDLPTLAIYPFEISGCARSDPTPAKSLYQTMGEVLSRFDLTNVSLDPSSPSINYQLRGFIEHHQDRTVSMKFTLLDRINGQIICTVSYDFAAVMYNQRTAEDAIMRKLAPTLLQPFGVISAHWQSKYSTSDKSPYRCLLSAVDLYRTFNQSDYHHARACLEQLTASREHFGPGFTYLSLTCNFGYLFDADEEAKSPLFLDKALYFARRGIELAPESARAYHALSSIYFARREANAGFATLNKAISCNPYDPVLQLAHGGRLVTSGRIEEGMNVLRQFEDTSSVLPTYQHFYFFLANYLTVRLPEASLHATAMTNDRYSYALVARALIAAAKGRRDQAKQFLERLIALYPSWRENPRGEMEKLIVSDSIVDKLATDLVGAGLTAIR
jgi:tetratricopeptide (TPR) repeat protein